MAVIELLNHCYDLLTSFHHGDEDSEIFLQNYLADKKITDPTLVRHLTVVFFGCVKFDRVIRVVVDAFYAKEGSTILLSERHVYTVLTYLVLFYIDTIGMAAFRKVVYALHIIRMHKFLDLLCNEQNLMSWMKESWKRIYDASFVESKLLAHALKWLPDLKDLIAQLERKITNSESAAPSDDYEDISSNEKPKRITTVQPFDLTKPKPRSVPLPELIPQMVKVRHPPESTYATPKERDAVEEKREENKRKAKALLDEANSNEFACATASRTKPAKVLKRIEELKLEEDLKHSYKPPHLNPTPKSTIRSDSTIKLNTAAILREKKLCEDVEKDQLRKIEELENGGFSDAQYRQWKSAMDQQQQEAIQADADRRLVEARLAREMAELAHAEAAVERKKLAGSMKDEAKLRMKEFLAGKILEQEEMRKMVDQMVADRGKITESKAKLKEIKQKIVQQVAQESREMLAQALEETEVEMKRRAELIAHIRAIESVPLVRQKLFDRTDSAGHGFLQEMSIAELEERLALTKAEREKDIMTRQDAIVRDKRQRQQMLTEAMDRIARHRMARSRIAAASKLKEAADADSLLSLTSSTSSRSLNKIQSGQIRDISQVTAEKRAQLQERRARVAEQMRSSSSTSNTQKGDSLLSGESRRHSKFRKMLEEEHYRTFEKAQRKTDQAIGIGQKKDWDSLMLLYS